MADIDVEENLVIGLGRATPRMDATLPVVEESRHHLLAFATELSP